MKCSGVIIIALFSAAGCATSLSSAGPERPAGLVATFAEALPAETPGMAGYRADARSIGPLIDRAYAYLDRFEAGRAPVSGKLRLEAEQVTDRRSLTRYAERVLLTLSDHHAITGSSLADSWAVVPSYADLWVIEDGGVYRVDAVRTGSPAQEAGIRHGDELASVDGVPVSQAVVAFWDDLGLPIPRDGAGFAARVLAAGRRDRGRRIGVVGDGRLRVLDLPSLYSTARAQRPPVTVAEQGGDRVIRINDSLGDAATIAAFDDAMAGARPGQPIVIDLTDTPGGGNTTVARAVLGWFVDRPTSYQVHNRPAEERATGIPRQWAEQVLPRQGKHHDGPVRVLVGRWTGSMGEGLAIGFDAIGAQVTGEQMAGLLGAVFDYRLEHSGLVVKLPAERLMHVEGTPREQFTPRAAEPDLQDTSPADLQIGVGHRARGGQGRPALGSRRSDIPADEGAFHGRPGSGRHPVNLLFGELP